MRHFGQLPIFLKPVEFSPSPAQLYMEGQANNIGRRRSMRGSQKKGKPPSQRRSSAQDMKPDDVPGETNHDSGLCGVCVGPVADSDDAVQCDGPCGKWVHAVCGGISPLQYDRMQKEEEGEWKCGECKAVGRKNARASPRVNARSSPRLEGITSSNELAKDNSGSSSEEIDSEGEPDFSASLTSPPRTPLGILNGPERAQGRQPSTPQEERNRRKLNKRNHQGETALHCAAIKGNTAQVRKLLRLGADPNTQDNAGWTPLHEASNRGNVEVARLLIQHGADIDDMGLAKETPLHDAAMNGHVKVVHLLVKSGANASALNAEKLTPLQVAESPENPCTNPHLQLTIQFLKGENVDEGSGLEESDGEHRSLFIDEVNDVGEKGNATTATSGTRSTPRTKPTGSTMTSAPVAQGKAATRSGSRGKAKVRNTNPVNPVEMSSGEEISSSGQVKEEDPNNVKLNSREPTLASRKGSSSSAVEAKEYEAREKRGAEEEPDEEGRRKKRKDDGALNNGGRGLSGNITEKIVGKSGGRLRGSAVAERKSPNSGEGIIGKEPNTSQALSPGAGTGLNVEMEPDMEGDKKEGSLKVPPLKIVINPTNTSRAGDEWGDYGNGLKMSYIVDKTVLEDKDCSEDKVNEGKSSEVGDKTSSKERFTRSRTNAPGGEGKESEADVEGTPSEAIPSPSTDGEKKSGAVNESEDYLHKKRKVTSNGNNGSINNNAGDLRNTEDSLPLTDMEKHLNIRKQIEQRRKNLFPVQPKPPQGFKDYLMNKKTYHLQGNMGTDSRIQPIPKLSPPSSLEGQLKDLFLLQENERYKLRMKHLVEKEKLVLAVEQEILRVHGRAARALANQTLPYSVCTFLRDEEVYTPIDPLQEENNRDVRSRYNGRLFLSWLQDVDDKWEKIKKQMVLRHHNEAESLNAIQKMDWEWEMHTINRDVLAKINPNNLNINVPLVKVNKDFDQLLS